MTVSKKTTGPNQQQPTQQAQGKAPTEHLEASDYAWLRDMHDPDTEVIKDDQGNETDVDRVAFRGY